MSRIAGLVLALTVTILLASATGIRAQNFGNIAINPYGGALIFDDGAVSDLGLEVDVGAIFGGRLIFSLPGNFRLFGAYGYAPLSMEASQFVVEQPTTELDANGHLFYGGFEYNLLSRVSPTTLLLSAGAGGMVFDVEGVDDETDFIVSVAAGLNHEASDRITFRAEVRDHIVFCTSSAGGVVEQVAACFSDETLNHIEISGGIEIWMY
jgi:hypothetical protein